MMTVEELLEKQNIIERNLELDLRKLEYLFVKSNTTSKINKIIYRKFFLLLVLYNKLLYNIFYVTCRYIFK